MSCKAAINTFNSGTQAVALGGTIALGAAPQQFGKKSCDRNCSDFILRLNGNGITAAERGFYKVNVSVTAAPTAAGSVTVTMFNNGVVVPGATASGSVSTANNPTNLSFPAIIYVPCSGPAANLTLVLTGTASNVTNVAVTVEKI